MLIYIWHWPLLTLSRLIFFSVLNIPEGWTLRMIQSAFLLVSFIVILRVKKTHNTDNSMVLYSFDNNPYSKQRLPWLDNAKMVAMICVIIGHTGSLFANGFPSRLLGIIVGFNMPLFVLLSGLVSLGALSRLVDFRSLADYYEKILWRMMIPAVALSAIDQAVKGMLFARKLWILYFFIVLLIWFVFRKPLIKEKMSKVPEKLLLFCKFAFVIFLLVSSLWLNMFWFLSMLMKLQLSTACIRYILNFTQISQKTQIVVISLLLWIGSYFFFDGWTFEMSIYLGIGLLIKQYEIIDTIFRMRLWVSALKFFLGCIICRLYTIDYGFYGSSLHVLLTQGLAYIYILRVIVALLLSSAIIRWVFALSKTYNWFSHAGSRSMAFYTIHALILETVLKGFYVENFDNYMWIFGFLFAFAFTAITYGIILICERCKLSRGLVLGDWK